MRLIPYAAFAKLRFADFLIGEMQVDLVSNWEFLNKKWVGEAINFSHFLRLEDEPAVLRAISLDLAAQPRKVWEAILRKIGLPLAYGMTLPEVKDVIGLDGKKLNVPRTTYRFVTLGSEPYEVHCTFDGEKRLAYVAVMRRDYKAKEQRTNSKVGRQ